MKRNAAAVVAVDIGGTSMKGARVLADGTIVARDRVPTPAARGSEAILDALAGLCRSLAGRNRPTSVGLGVAGAIRADEGVVASSPNIPCWVDCPIGPQLAAKLGVPVAVDNDANLHAVGEHWRGAGRGHRNLLLATLGTGVGGGVILGGKLWHGDGGRAGELGHTVVAWNGRPCACGARGCLEAYAGAKGLTAIWRERHPNDEDTSPKELADRARAGQKGALKVWAEAGRALGIALASWVQILDVRTILVGGGISPALDLLEPFIRRELAARLFGMDPGEVAVLRAALGDDAGILGAARIAFDA